MKAKRTHPMIASLKALTGNPRACVLTEPLWGIPHSLFVPFVSVYMLALGLTDIQIGLSVSLTLLMRAVTAAISGAVTDKLGRRTATIIFDVISWSLPCLLWAMAQNVWWFYIAAVFNGFMQITDNSWTCLLVEDADKRRMVSIYSWIYVAGQLSVFFAPLSSLLVEGMGIVSAMRVLYLFSFASMTAKFVILYFCCTETEVGRVRLKETKGMSLGAILLEYKSLIPRFFRSGSMMMAMTLSVLFTAASTIMDTFFGVYTTQTLLLSDHFLAYFPIIRSAIMLVFLFFVQPWLERFGFKGPMLVGIGLYVLSHLLLVLLPGAALFEGNALMVPMLYTVAQSCAYGLVMPRKDSIVALSLDKQERARMTSIMTVIMLGINIPFGYISGLLSDVHRSLPFLLNIALFVVAFAVIVASKRLAKDGGLAAD